MAPDLPHHTVVCGLIQAPEGTWLAARRATGALAGLWEFPGGKLEPQETREQAICRELHEELGISVEVLRLGTPVFHTYPACTVELIPIFCRLVAGEPQGTDHTEIRWITKAQAAELAWCPADIPLLEQLVQFSHA